MQKAKITRFNGLKLIIPGLFCMFTLAWLCRALLLGYYPDFNTQYYSAKYAFSGVNPYSPNVGLYTPQVYPPTEFFFFLPFTLFPIQISAFLYVFMSLIALVLSIVILSRTFNIKIFSPVGLSLAGLSFAMFPVKFTLGMGQVNIFILLLMVLALYFLKSKKDKVSGVMVGIAFIIKLFPVFVPIFFLTKLKSKVLVGFLITVIAGILISLLVLPQNINITFIASFTDLVGSWKLDYYNQSISGFIGRNFGITEVGSIVRTTLSGLLSVFVFLLLIRKKSKNFTDLSLIFGILIALNLILNTFSWQHHFVLLLIPLYVTFSYLHEHKYRWFLYYFLGLSYFLTSINMSDPSKYSILYTSHVLYGAIILLGLMLYLLTRQNSLHPKV